MTTAEMTGIERDPEGFLTDPSQWSEDVAEAIAHEAGIAELTPRHWLVVNYMRETYLSTGQAPSIRTLGKESGVQVSIVISKGSLEGIYPGLIMANGARMEGMEANVFFTFFGLDAITKKRQARIKVATVGNPGMHIPTIVGAVPGMSWLATKMMSRKMEKLDIPPVPEFVEMIADSGAGVYGCKATVDMFGLSEDDFVPQVTGVITVGEFYEKAAGGEIVFT